MLHEDAGEDATATDRRRRYERAVADAVEAVGVDRAAAATGIRSRRLAALTSEAGSALTVDEAAALLALSPSSPDAERIREEARDALLLGMAGAVTDAEALASDLSTDGEALRAQIEGRRPMTLARYARVRQVLASSGPD